VSLALAATADVIWYVFALTTVMPYSLFNTAAVMFPPSETAPLNVT
jgi:hypothetical protein